MQSAYAVRETSDVTAAVDGRNQAHIARQMTMSSNPTPAPSGKTRVADALTWIDLQVARLGFEDVPVMEAAERVLASDVQSAFDLPPFDRAAVDGVAVRADETIGASTYNPCILGLRTASGNIAAGCAVRIDAGNRLPHGADAVVALEQVDIEGENLTVTEPVATGGGIQRRASQAPGGSTIISAGRRLQAADIGWLGAAGLARVPVVRRPRVRCVVAASQSDVDTNGPLLRALIHRDGGLVLDQPIIQRDRISLSKELRLPGADVVLVAGGSGLGSNDHAAAALADAGARAIRGVALRHAESAGMGVACGVPVFLLPGTPSGCLLAYEFFAGRAIRRLGARNPGFPYVSRVTTAVRKIVSEIGMTELRPVRFSSDGGVEPIAGLGEAGLGALARAAGFVVISEDSEGYPVGASVTVYLYDGYDRAQT